MSAVILVSGLAFVLIGLLVTAGILAAVSRRGGEMTRNVDAESGAHMFRTAYIYLVLLATLMMTIGGSVAAFMAIADLVSPQPYYQTFAEYSRLPDKAPGQSTPALSQAELQRNYDQMVSQQQLQTRGRALNSLIKSLGWIVIPLPVFVYYQRKVKKPPESAGGA